MAGITDNKKNNSIKYILVACGVVIVALLVVVIVLLINNNSDKDSKDIENKRNVVVNEENAEEVIAELDEQETTPIGSYEVKMNSNWVFEDGSSASENAYVENVKNNTNPVYFDIVRSDNNETIFESPILPLGSHLEKITLDKKLEAGTYDCVCTYHLLDEQDKSVSQVSISVTIVVKK